jgi:hypothetical protein
MWGTDPNRFGECRPYPRRMGPTRNSTLLSLPAFALVALLLTLYLSEYMTYGAPSFGRALYHVGTVLAAGFAGVGLLYQRWTTAVAAGAVLILFGFAPARLAPFLIGVGAYVAVAGLMALQRSRLHLPEQV